MGEPLKEVSLKKFGCVGVLEDSTDNSKLSLAQNVRGRPVNAISGPPIYQRLCQIGNSAFVDATYFALTYTPFGGSPRALVRVSDKTIAIQVTSQGKNWLLFYSLNTHKARGLFHLGDDGSFNGTPDFVGGTATMTVLAVGLDDNARWHGAAYYGAWHLGNGVDPNSIVQLTRTSLAPGKWRLAGSNQRPAAAVLRQLQPSGTDPVQAWWTIPGGARFNFSSDGFPFSSSSSLKPGLSHVNGVGATGLFTKTNPDTSGFSPAIGHGYLPGDQLKFDFDVDGTGTKSYFVIASGLTFNTLKVSTTLGGSAVTFSPDVANSTVFCCSKLYVPGQTFAVGDIVNVSTEGSFALDINGVFTDALVAGTDYYVVAVSPDQVAVSLTLGGTPVLYSSNTIGTCTIFIKAASGTRQGGASLTFTAALPNFPGTLGDNIYVSVTYGTGLSGASQVASTLTGSGTVSDPYHYALYTGSGFSSTQAIVDFVNLDTNAIGILEASASAVDTTEDPQSWAFHELTGGVDGTLVNGLPVGLSDKSCSVYLRYWDPGVDFLGYEGISSDKSNVIVIDALSNYSIEVAVTPSPTVESGRFGFIRIYFQQGEDTEAQWNLVGEVPNAFGSKVFTTFAPVACTADIATDRFTKAAHGLADNTALRFSASGSLPGGISSGTTYYVLAATTNDFKVSLTPGGAAVNLITSAGSGISYRLVQALSAAAQPFQSGDVVRFTTTGTLPTGLALLTDYFIINAAVNSFGVTPVAGGTPIDITSAGSGVHTATLKVVKLIVGVNTPIGAVMMMDQNRPLPSALTVFAGGNVWNGGVSEFPDRLYPSKQATDVEAYPEGANSMAYEIVSFPESVSGSQITALYADNQNLYVHSPGAIVVFPPATPDNKTYPRVFAGAVTDSALVVWTKNRLMYLGANLELFEQTQSAITPLQSDSLALDAGAFVRSLTDLNAFAAHPERVFMFSDERGQSLWFWVPGRDGSLIGFCFDQVQRGIVGPFTYPKVYAMVKMEVGRPEYILTDESGNLFVWRSDKQFDFDQTLPTNATPTVHTLGSGATTPSEAGYGQTAVPDLPVFYPNNFTNNLDPSKVAVNVLHGLVTGNQVTVVGSGLYDGTWTITRYDNSNFYLNGAVYAGNVIGQGHYTSPQALGELWRSVTCSMETGFLDFSRPSVMKSFLGLLVTSVKNSRGRLTLTLTDKSGRSVVRVYGDVFEKSVRNVSKVLFTMGDTAIKIRLDMITAENRPWVIRDMTLLWRGMGQI